MPLYTICFTKGFLAKGTEPTFVNSSGAESRLRKRKNEIYIGFHVIKFHCFLLAPSPPPPPHFCCFPYTTTTTANTFLLFSFHHHHHYRRHHISIVFPPPAPHFYFSHHHHHRHRISIVFPPPSPKPPHFHCFLPQPSPPPHFYCFPSTTTITSFPFFPSTRFYERLPTTILSSFCSNVSCSEQQSWFSSFS